MRNKLICITIVALILLVQKDSFAYADVVVEDVEVSSIYQSKLTFISLSRKLLVVNLQIKSKQQLVQAKKVKS